MTFFGSLVNRLSATRQAPAAAPAETAAPALDARAQDALDHPTYNDATLDVRALARSLPPRGSGATILLHSDRHACTIIATGTARGGQLKVQRDIATVDTESVSFKAGHRSWNSEFYDYIYTPNPNALEQIFSLRKNGRWVAQGESSAHGTSLMIGSRNEYHDPTF